MNISLSTWLVNTCFKYRFKSLFHRADLASISLKSSDQRCSVCVLRNFAKFTGKHPCQSLFVNKVAGAACKFIKKETLPQVFSCEFCKTSKNNYLTGRLLLIFVTYILMKQSPRNVL